TRILLEVDVEARFTPACPLQGELQTHGGFPRARRSGDQGGAPPPEAAGGHGVQLLDAGRDSLQNGLVVFRNERAHEPWIDVESRLIDTARVRALQVVAPSQLHHPEVALVARA